MSDYLFLLRLQPLSPFAIVPFFATSAVRILPKISQLADFLTAVRVIHR
jgi:hypothetical protein